jgi:hypothetical protein
MQCRKKMLPTQCIGRRFCRRSPKSEEDSAHGAGEAHYQEQATKQGSTRSGNRRNVTGGCRQRSIRFNRWCGDGYPVAERGASGGHARRRGNLRRQPVDLLCVRQRNCCSATGREGRLGPLRRLPVWRLPLRLERLLGLRMRRLLRVVGTLPHLLGHGPLRPGWQRRVIVAGS